MNLALNPEFEKEINKRIIGVVELEYFIREHPHVITAPTMDVDEFFSFLIKFTEQTQGLKFGQHSYYSISFDDFILKTDFEYPKPLNIAERIKTINAFQRELLKYFEAKLWLFQALKNKLPEIPFQPGCLPPVDSLSLVKIKNDEWLPVVFRFGTQLLKIHYTPLLVHPLGLCKKRSFQCKPFMTYQVDGDQGYFDLDKVSEVVELLNFGIGVPLFIVKDSKSDDSIDFWNKILT